jgi:hypothetical protein
MVTPPSITLWSGARLRTGHLGRPQQWLNLTGRVFHAPPGTILSAKVGEASARTLALGPDGHRLAAPGDFNLDVDPQTLPLGETAVCFTVLTPDGLTTTATAIIERLDPVPPWPIPWSQDFTRPGPGLADRVQIVDGDWQLGPAGVFNPEAYYDRVLAFGDSHWTDYEVTARLRLRGQRLPVEGRDAGHDVIHVALTLRWPGHHDDGHQPFRRWYPLGVTCEFRLLEGPARLRWRMLDPREITADPAADKTLDWEQPFYLKARVTTPAPGESLYQCKAWPADQAEPAAWDLDHHKTAETITSGGALFIAHYTHVLLETLAARPL